MICAGATSGTERKGKMLQCGPQSTTTTQRVAKFGRFFPSNWVQIWKKMKVVGLGMSFMNSEAAAQGDYHSVGTGSVFEIWQKSVFLCLPHDQVWIGMSEWEKYVTVAIDGQKKVWKGQVKIHIHTHTHVIKKLFITLWRQVIAKTSLYQPLLSGLTWAKEKGSNEICQLTIQQNEYVPKRCMASS